MPLPLITPSTGKKTRREEALKRLEALWRAHPNQFNPQINCREIERIERTWALIQECGPLEGKRVADLGCGRGVLSKRMRDHGALVDAVDLSSLALNYLQNEPAIKLIQDYIPRTTLNDYYYDLVISTDVIAYLPKEEHRLFMNEMARLIKRTGDIICSTPLDFHSEDPLEIFTALAETEFMIDKWIFSYHKLHMTLAKIFPVIEKNRGVMLALEQITPESGLSHVIFKGHKKPLL